MLYYKGYRAEDMATGESFEAFPGVNGDVTVSLPAGYCGTLHVWYAGMWYWHIAEAVSLLTVIWMACTVMKSRKA